MAKPDKPEQAATPATTARPERAPRPSASRSNIVGQYFCVVCGREAERWVPKSGKGKGKARDLLENDTFCAEHAPDSKKD